MISAVMVLLFEEKIHISFTETDFLKFPPELPLAYTDGVYDE